MDINRISASIAFHGYLWRTQICQKMVCLALEVLVDWDTGKMYGRACLCYVVPVSRPAANDAQ